MGKKKHRHDWAEAKKLCHLNQNDITMAKVWAFGRTRWCERGLTQSRSGSCR